MMVVHMVRIVGGNMGLTVGVLMKCGVGSQMR